MKKSAYTDSFSLFTSSGLEKAENIALILQSISSQKEIFDLLVQYGANTDIRVKGKELIDLVKSKKIRKDIIRINKKNKNILWFIRKNI